MGAPSRRRRREGSSARSRHRRSRPARSSTRPRGRGEPWTRSGLHLRRCPVLGSWPRAFLAGAAGDEVLGQGLAHQVCFVAFLALRQDSEGILDLLRNARADDW
ncbi:hypothetical protein DWB68_15540 [Galactobacter valiniphilus]|uniref:Uncharacterized protein n=1 Tax=Galactobacter valiniphilus TaxID=2676122 RepID=A0A399J655_9MICC|nr:hypothetical protein DWB68_15540 [Galactobacter valiniphilus]